MNVFGHATVVRPVAGLFHTALPEQVLLLDTAGNRYFSLEGVGAPAWELMVGGASLAAVHSQLLDRYDVSPDRLWLDLTRLVRDLEEAGLVEVSQDFADPNWPETSAPDPDGTVPSWNSDSRGDRSVSSCQMADILEAALERRSVLRLRALGGSMWPAIRDGDTVTVSPPAGRLPSRGDVIAARHPASGRLVLHRVVSVDGDGLLLRGDNARRADGVIPMSAALGLVSSIERQDSRARSIFCPTTPWHRPLLWLYLLWLDFRFALLRRRAPFGIGDGPDSLVLRQRVSGLEIDVGAR